MDRKALTRAYKETPRPMGVYWIRNTVTGRSLVASSVNLKLSPLEDLGFNPKLKGPA